MVGPAMKRGHFSSVILLLAVGVVSGCGSSQMSRIDRNRDIYETWPIETRQAVLDGRVEPGMTPDMVRVTWGEPSEVVAQSSTGDEIWVYKIGGSEGSVIYPGGGLGTVGGMGTTGPGIGISTGRGGTSVGAIGGVGIGGSMGGIGVGGPTIGIGSGVGGMGGMGGVGGMGSPIVTPPTPPDIREVVFRNGVVHRADKP